MLPVMSISKVSQGSRCGSMAQQVSEPVYSNSSVWVSHHEATRDRWITVKGNLSRVRFDRSPFVPQGFAEYVDLIATQAEESAKAERQRLANLESLPVPDGRAQHAWINPFEGKRICDNLSPVLSLPTLWSPWYEYTILQPESPWPSPEEFKEEGDERHTSGFGRFLPVPRKLGNETANYKLKIFKKQYALDHVNPVLHRQPFPRFTEEEEQNLADRLILHEQIGMRPKRTDRKALTIDQVALPVVPVHRSRHTYLRPRADSKPLRTNLPSLQQDFGVAIKDKVERSGSKGAGGKGATDDDIMGASCTGDHTKSPLVSTKVRDLFRAHLAATAAKALEPLKALHEYETTVEEDNETTVSESTLDNGATMTKTDRIGDVSAAILKP